jgi:hypothetical protein
MCFGSSRFRRTIDSTNHFAIQKVQLAAEAFRDAALMVERYFPGMFNGMSLMFKTELVAMTCSLHGSVQYWLRSWQFNFHLYPADVTNCRWLFRSSIHPTVEIGVRAAFARSFKNEKGDTWIKLDERWEKLNTRLTAEELCQQFMKDILQMTTKYIDWIKCRDSGERDLLLKNRYGNLRWF